MQLLILLIFLLAEIILSLKKPLYGLMCYYAIRMIIPSCARVSSFSFNTLALFVLIVVVLPKMIRLYRKLKNEDLRYVKNISGIVIGLFIISFFGRYVPLVFQWSLLLQTYMTEMLPSIILFVLLRYEKEYKMFCNLIAFLAIFTAVYGIYTYISQVNPIYTFFNNSSVEGKILEEYATGRSGTTGIAVGIYDDKIALSLISLLLFCFLVNKTFIPKYILYMSVILTFIDIFLTTQRTGLFCGLLFSCLLLFDKRPNVIKSIWKPAVLIVGLSVLFLKTDVLKETFYSIIYIFDDEMQEKLGAGGSSTSMRMGQLFNVVNYLGIEGILFGGGYGFSTYYYTAIFDRTIYGVDYRFSGFESFIIQIISSSGIVGLIIWTIGLYKLYKCLYSSRFILYNQSFYLLYLLAIIMTDTSASLYLFFFLAVLNAKVILIKQYQSIYFNIKMNKLDYVYNI